MFFFFFLGVTHVFIGLHDLNNESIWEWSDGSKCMNDTNITHDCSAYWAEGEPNDHKIGEDCSQFKIYDSVLWLINDISCTNKYAVLCNQAS